jgi:pimeloyl-ACP methyl ester carboxylesterase
MARIRAKTLIIPGDTGRVFPSSSAQVRQKGIANSKVIIFKECGRVPMLEKPEKTTRHLPQFIS